MDAILVLACGGAASGFCYLLLAPVGFAPGARRMPLWSQWFQHLGESAGRWAVGAEPMALEVAGVGAARLAVARVGLAAVGAVILLLLHGRA